jgi:hypothetical protein
MSVVYRQVYGQHTMIVQTHQEQQMYYQFQKPQVVQYYLGAVYRHAAYTGAELLDFNAKSLPHRIPKTTFVFLDVVVPAQVRSNSPLW